MKNSDIQGDHVVTAYEPGQGTAATADEWVIFVAPFDCTVTGVDFITEANITGQATNYFTAQVTNVGTDGTGTTAVAALAFDNGTDATANVPTALTLSSTAADLDVSAGDVLTFEKVVTASGLACPAGVVQVHYQSN